MKCVFLTSVSACLILCAWALPCANAEQPARGRTFYVDSEAGQDSRDGQSPDRAWRSLERVNAAELKPGDAVRFRRGGIWRGSLVPASGEDGAPITYTSFGEGPKPLILGSLARSRPADWVKVRENVWATPPGEYRSGKRLLDLREGAWARHQEAGARLDLTRLEDPSGPIWRLTCIRGGSASNHVQLWGPELAVEKGAWLRLAFRARSSKPFRFPSVGILEGRSPWTRHARFRPVERPIGAEWESHEVFGRVVESSAGARLHIGLGALLAPGGVFEFQPQSLDAVTPSIADPLDVDVGNMIFDDGAVCGWKKWSIGDLVRPYDYYYEPSSERVYLWLPEAPAARHRSIELAMRRHVVQQSGAHHVVYDGLAVKYGAAHGFGGGNTHDLVIRNCDLAYIGGGHQLTRPNGTPVRFGNAIEFWGAAHDNLVEGCHIWEVYDAALTNQGRGPGSRQINITYRNNLIHNSEYSFEYWNNPETAVTRNIRFVNNTCIDAGSVWSHAQRPDRNGSHLMFYRNTAATSGIEIKYNIFCGVTEWGSRYSGGWEVRPDMDHNLWFSKTGVMVYWFRDKIAAFKDYQAKTGLDAHSRFADPLFVDPAAGDYRLAAGSPARRIRPDVGPVGAAQFWTEPARGGPR